MSGRQQLEADRLQGVNWGFNEIDTEYHHALTTGIQPCAQFPINS